MCIIIKQYKGHSFSNDQIGDFYWYNKDGFGVMWHDEKRGLRHVRMLPRDAQQAVEMYRKHADGKECVIHYRWATHGSVTVKHAHPFVIVPKRLVMVHNGVLSGFGSSDKSDTLDFVDSVLKPALADDPSRIHQPWVQALIKPHLGGTLVFVDEHGQVATIGDSGSIEVDGIWYSNTYAWSSPSKKIEQSKRADPDETWDSWIEAKRRYYGGTSSGGTRYVQSGNGSAYVRAIHDYDDVPDDTHEHALALFAAESPDTDPEELDLLSEMESSEIRCAVARNPSTPSQTLYVMSMDLDSAVREALLSNPYLPDSLVADLMEGEAK